MRNENREVIWNIYLKVQSQRIDPLLESDLSLDLSLFIPSVCEDLIQVSS